MRTLIFSLAISLTSQFAEASILFDDPLLVDTDISTAYIPAGFDSNDRVVIMVEGSFSDTCYRVGPQKVIKDEEKKTITVFQQAYQYEGPCIQLIVNYSQTINLGILKPGTYTVLNGGDQTELGKLNIAIAKNRGPDDILYAPLTDATIKRDKLGRVTATVNVFFSNRCMKLKDIKVAEDGKNVITVLPIAETVNEQRCRLSVPYNYSRTVLVPELDGKYGRFMLNARSLNGQAVTKLFDL